MTQLVQLMTSTALSAYAIQICGYVLIALLHFKFIRLETTFVIMSFLVL